MYIGRNDACFCGSGKKYKKCCMDNLESINRHKLTSEFDKPTLQKSKHKHIEYFSNFNSAELLKILAFLQLFSLNHGKNIRIDDIQRQIILSDKGSLVKASYSEIEKYIGQNFRSHHLEDPPENLFTENIMTSRGNYTIFPGLSEGHPFILQQFLKILSEKDSIKDNNLRVNTLNSCLFLLKLSDIIATNFGYTRNIGADLSDGNAIYFPPEMDFYKYSTVFEFSKIEIDELLLSFNLRHEHIEDYLIHLENIELLNSEPDKNPIIYKPLRRFNETYIVLSPTNLVFAGINNILRQFQKKNILDNFLEIFAKQCSSYSNFIFSEIGFRQVHYPFSPTPLPIIEHLFLFDQNKIAYVCIFFDNGEGYNVNSPLSTFYGDKNSDKVSERQMAIFLELKQDKHFQDFELFFLKIINGIGRAVSFSTETVSEEVVYLGISMHELDIFFKSRKWHELTLFNFAKALQYSQSFSTSFIDAISYFIEHDESFYTNDDKLDFLIITPGYGLSYKKDAVQYFDEHLALFNEGHLRHLLPVSREKLPAKLPIYSTGVLKKQLSYKIYTECVGIPMWILPKENIYKIKSNEESFRIQICIAIAYWLNEFSPILKLAFVEKSNKSINIFISSSPLIINNVPIRSSGIKINIVKGDVFIDLDENFNHSLYKLDNTGERELMKKLIYNLLSTFSDYDENSIKHTIKSVTEKYIPVGKKKKLIVQIPDKNIRIDDKNTYKVRMLSSFEINKQLDNLGIILTDKPYKPRKITDETKKNSLVNKIVSYFDSNLRSLLEKYDFTQLLKILLSYYESTIQKRELSKLDIVAQIECFKHHCDIEKYIFDKNKKNIQTIISLRCLIEYIVAYPPKGKKHFNLECFDISMAYMNNIINWGFVSDGLNFKINNIEIDLLPSGRVGTDKIFEKNIMNTYYNQKFSEDIFDYQKNFDKMFEVSEKGNSNNEENADVYTFKKAFYFEFEFPFDDFIQLIEYSIDLARADDEPVYYSSIEVYKKSLTDKFNFSHEIIEKFIDQFSICERKDLNGKEYKSYDFFPWQFNRNFSILKKPFILVNSEDKVYILYGFRTIHDFYLNLGNKIFRGKYQAKSPEMKSFLSSVNDKNGKDFNEEVYKLLKKKFSNCIVMKEIGIGPKSKLFNPINIGDIDILLINPDKRKILAVECKCISASKTPFEMNNEFLKFIGGNKPWIPKTDKRKEWMMKNLNSLSNLDTTIPHLNDYEFEYIYITNEAIPLPLIKAHLVEYRFISLYDIEIDINSVFGEL
ncbi:YecA family protein [Emticicia sp. SJ17W-69]|uniref:YecA family protein n=1 Tax=Emticicia sp. SJ17W-69 TaxID=3421657 RepID=UPI003EBB96FD